MSDNNDFLETLTKSHILMQQLMPIAVLAHEEFSVPVSAHNCGVKSLFLTDWFVNPDHIWMKSLSYCDIVVFMDQPGIYTVPPTLSPKLRYCQPVIRPLAFSAGDRAKARQQLAIAPDQLVLSCFTGTKSDLQTPIRDILARAIDLLPCKAVTLIWVGREKVPRISKIFANRCDFRLISVDPCPERIMVASDCGITKATRSTLREFQLLKVPTVTLSDGTNWTDDVLASRIVTNVPLDSRSVSPEQLAAAINTAIQLRQPTDCTMTATQNTAVSECEHFLRRFL